MVKNIITYEVLYEILRREKYNQELQKLDSTFFNDVINYIKEKNAILESQKEKENVFSKLETGKTEKQIQNIKKILKELYERRENKILQQAIFDAKLKQKSELENTLPEEKQIYNRLFELLTSFRRIILDNLLSANLPNLEEPKVIKIQKNESLTKLIRIVHAIPRFVGEDLRVYGPFEEENIANLPTNIANLLIKKGRAEEI